MTEPQHHFQQRLGLFSATMLVTGTMVGSGIFIVSAEMSRDVGGAGWLLLLWILTGVITILGGLCYAELAGAMPRVGGQYVYLKEAFGPLCGFLYGWSAFTVIQCGSIAAVAVAFAKFLGVLVPGLGTGPEATIFEMPLHISIPLQLPWMPEAVPLFERDIFTISMGQVVATGVIVLLTVVNCLGVAAGAWVQNLFTVAKLLALGLVIVVGLTVALDPDVIRRNWATAFDRALDTDRIRQAETLTGLAPSLAFFLVAAGAMVGSLFSADAWANLTFTSGEVRDPHRTVPRSLVLGTCLVIALYLLCNMAYLAVLPANGDAELAKQLAGQAKGDRAHVEAVYAGSAAQLGISNARDERVGTAVMEVASPRWGRTLMALAVMVSTFGCVNGMILMSARLMWAMAHDKLFYRGARHLNRRGAPQVALILQAIWAILLLFSGTYSELLDYVIFASLLFYALTVASLIRLRFTKPELPRPFRVPFYPFLPIVYAMLCISLMLALLIVRPGFTWPGLLIVALGIPVYGMFRLMGGRDEAQARAGS